ncbi:MAG: hypothetical protein IJ566_02525, partial [Cardiobacteriaceae bacterium]|nr:hypothetical protein [Cardiobacteriaceae bacterium]
STFSSVDDSFGESVASAKYATEVSLSALAVLNGAGELATLARTGKTAEKIVKSADNFAEGVGKSPATEAQKARQIDINAGLDGEMAGQPIQLHSLSNYEARVWYLEQERNIPNLLDKSASLKTQSQQAVEARNEIRTAARELMADRVEAERLYREEPNRDWDYFADKYSKQGYSGDALYQKIIDSSQKSRKEVNEKLGITK